MMEWISTKNQLPQDWDEIYIKTDCEECPVVSAIFLKGNFTVPVIIECDRHLETDEKFNFIKAKKPCEVQGYVDRITHWMLKPQEKYGMD